MDTDFLQYPPGWLVEPREMLAAILQTGWFGLSEDELRPEGSSSERLAGGSPDDQALRLAQLGDREAFALLYDRYGLDVVRLCTRLIGAQEAEDARNEVFLRAQRALPGYDPGRSMRSWLLSIAAHHCVDLLRRQKLEGRLFDPAQLDEHDLPSAGPTPLRATLQAESQARTLAAVDALPAHYRAPLALRYFAELPYDEIAEILGVSRGQVGTLLYRAKVRLRTSLAGRARS